MHHSVSSTRCFKRKVQFPTMDSSNFSSLGEAKFGGRLSKDGDLCTSEGSNCPFNDLDEQQLKSDCLALSAVGLSLTVCLWFKEFGLRFFRLLVIFWMYLLVSIEHSIPLSGKSSGLFLEQDRHRWWLVQAWPGNEMLFVVQAG